MKNHYNPQRFLQSLMRVTFLAILITGILSGVLGAASIGHAQGEELAGITVLLDAEHATVKQVLKDLEQQTGLAFGYSHAYMDLDRRVTVKSTSEKINLQQALEQIFAGTRTTWALSNGVVQLKTWPEKNAQTGVIAGRITDAETGDPMPGATMQIEGTTRGASADEDGTYRLEKVEPGTYTLIFSFVGYQKTRAEGIQVKAQQVTTVNATLVPKTSRMDEVVITAEVDVDTAPVIEATDVTVVNTISESNMVISGISAEQIARTPDSDAAEVVRRAPGVTLTGSYVNLRGLSDRHTATYIDGMSAPATAQYSSSFSYDLLPAGVIDQVLVYKSPAAELPGDWGGGVVKILTKNTSVARELQVSVKGEYDSQATFQEYTTQKNSSTDWLGYDGGLRRIPDEVFTYNTSDDPIQKSAASQKLPETWNLLRQQAGPAWSGKLKYYDSWKPFGLRINNLTSLKYSRSTDLDKRVFSNSLISRSTADSEGNTIPEEDRPTYEELTEEYFNSADSEIGTEKVRISALQNLGFWINDNHRIRLKNLFNQLGSNQSSFRVGNVDLFVADGAGPLAGVKHKYMQRTLYNGQLSGEHSMGNHHLDWRGGYGYAREQVPDRRIAEFAVGIENRYDNSVRNNPDDYRFRLQQESSAKSNSRAWTDSREDIYTFGLDYQWELPFGPELKAGAAGEWKTRGYRNRLVHLGAFPSGKVRDSLQVSEFGPWYTLDQDEFRDEHFGVGSEYLSWQGSTVEHEELDLGEPDPSTSFDAETNVRAAYGSVMAPLWNDAIELYGGVRFEQEERVIERDLVTEAWRSSSYESQAWLPSFSLKIQPWETIQFRASAGKTVDRPGLREASSFYFFDYEELIEVAGNPNLETSEIWNYDVRIGWFPRPGEQISLTGFYKTMDKPIEFVHGNFVTNPRRTWLNLEEGEAYGMELELRKRLDFLPARPFQFLSVFGNGTWQDAQVKRGEEVSVFDPERPMQGSAPYVVNAGLTYDQPDWGMQASVLYNLIGPKILVAEGLGAQRGSIVQGPVGMVDLQFAQDVTPWLQVKATVENLFNVSVTEFLDGNRNYRFDPGEFAKVPNNPTDLNRYERVEYSDVVRREYKEPRIFSLSLKMTL